MLIRDQKVSFKDKDETLFLCSALSRLSSISLSPANPELLIAQILKEVRKIFNAKLSWIFLVEDDKIKLQSLSITKRRKNLVRTQLFPQLTPEILKRTYPILCNNAGELYKKSRGLYRFLSGQNVDKFMGVPLYKGNELSGTLNLGRESDSFDFSQRDLKCLTQLANVMAITILNPSEKTLEKSQEFLESIIDTLPNPIFIKDRKHRWTFLNKALSDMVGYSRKKMLRKSDYDFFPKNQADFFWKKDEEMFRTGKTVDIPEEPITDKEGKIHFLHTKKAPLRDSSGKITHLVGIIEDITKRKKAEEALQTERDRLELVTQHIGVGLAIISKDYRTLWANRVLKQWFGDVEGKICYSTYNQRTGICPGCGVREVFETGKLEVVHEQVGKDKHGKTIWSQIIATPIKDKQGNITASLEVVVPITHRKLAEEALRVSEEKYRLLVENVQEGIYSTHKGIFTSVNESMCRLFGYEREELIGIPAWNLAVSDQRNMVKKMFIEKMAKKDFSPVEVPCMRKDGSVFIAEIRLSALSEKQQSLGVVSDITDRKRAEEALRASENKYRVLLENLPQNIFLKDKNSVYISCNENYARALKVSPEEIVGKVDYDFYPKELAEKYRADDKRIMRSGKIEELEERYIQNGEDRFVHTVKIPLKDEQNRVNAILGIFWDITQHKRAEDALHQSEEKYRLLVENANEGIIVAQDGWLKFANPKMTEIMGYSGEELLSKPFVEFIHPDDQKMVLERHIKRLKGEELPQVYPFRIITKEGNVKWLEINAVVITWEGRPATLNFLSDITQRELMEKLLVQRERTARERARLLTDLRNLCEIDDILTRVCEAVRDSGLFERAVMTLHEPGGKIVNLGQVGLSPKIVERARQAPPVDDKLKAKMTSKRFRISDSFFIPVEAGLDLTKSARYIPQKGKNSVNGDWQAGDELFVPLRDFSGEVMGYLSVDTPSDGRRPDVETIQALETLVESAAARVREVEANKAVQESERKYRTLVETAQVGISISGPDENIVFVNQALADLLGHKKEELLGKNLKDICDQAQYATFKYQTEKRKRGESSKYEAKLQTKSGKQKHVYVSAAPLWGEDGSLIGSLGVLSDLTEIRKAREYDVLLNTSRALSQTLKFDQVIKIGAEKMTQALKADRCAVLLTEDDLADSKIMVRVYTPKMKVPSPVSNLKITKEQFSAYKSSLQKEGYLQILDARIGPVPEVGKKILRKAGIKSYLIIPIILSQKMVAIFHVGMTKKTMTFSPEEVGLVRTMANQVATALQNCRLMEDLKIEHSRIIDQAETLRRQTQEKDILLNVSQALAKTMGLDEICKVASKVVGSAMGAERCVVMLVTIDGNHLEVKGAFCKDDPDFQNSIGKTFSVAESAVFKNNIAKGKPFVITDSSNLPDTAESREYFLRMGLKYALGTSMFFGKKLVGVLTIAGVKKHKISTEVETKLLLAVGNQIAVAIENARLMEVVEKHTQDLKELSSQLMRVQENERKRIAQELHDEVGQMLQSMKMNLDRIKKNLSMEPKMVESTKDWLIDTEKLLFQTIDDIRTLTFDLRPSMLDDFGLVPTLRWYVDDYTRRSNIKVFLKGKEEKYRFPPEIEVNLYRIIQEALTNVAKHAYATEVSIFLSQKDSTTILSVKDNGVGFDANTVLSSPQRGMGIFNMKERVSLLGGSFEIISQPHKGTRVNVKIPFTEVKHEEGQITGR
jgi:PAS domain S-box-containing protein